jgi:hypothetical protein
LHCFNKKFDFVATSLLQEIITSLTCTYFGEETIKKPVAVLEHMITQQLANSRFALILVERYLGFFAKFGNLLELNLKCSNVGDDSLQTIGNCCKNLKYSTFILFLHLREKRLLNFLFCFQGF